MAKYEVLAQFIGMMFVDVEANSPEEAKEKFLAQMETNINDFGEPSVTLNDVYLPTNNPIKLDELNICFVEELTDEMKKHWMGIDIEEIED